MRARLVVFPIRGRNWCFIRSIDPSSSETASAYSPSTIRELWKRISFKSEPLNANAELVIDFISNKMNKGWTALEKAPDGSFKNKLHGLGLRLLARVKPSENLLKSISKEVTNVQVTYPPSLNPRLVRRRLRHIAMRGTIIHRKYFYGSVTLLPLTSALSVLPLPNIPFFWVLFRSYSNWRALKGSEKLLQLVSDYSQTQNSALSNNESNEMEDEDSKHQTKDSKSSPWVLEPSKELEDLLCQGHENGDLSEPAIADICKAFRLDKNDVLKYKKLM
ncbi:hypothetical protein SLE2022_307390 [Rubroshorea leprosula]